LLGFGRGGTLVDSNGRRLPGIGSMLSRLISGNVLPGCLQESTGLLSGRLVPGCIPCKTHRRRQ
jgi:hypothetical protein